MGDATGIEPLSYFPCRHAGSVQSFRGPGREMSGRFVAAIGGAETFGPFVPRPFPALLEERVGLPVINLGLQQAGLPVIAGDPAVAHALDAAALCVVQPPPPHALSNPFYRVHPRRNDRFLAATDQLTRLFPEVDLVSVHFTGHLVRRLRDTDPQRFQIVARALRRAWQAEVSTLLARARGATVLLWIDRPDGPTPQILRPEDRVALSRQASATVRLGIVAENPPTRGMIFAAGDLVAARQSLTPDAHARIAKALAPAMTELLGETGDEKTGPATGTDPA